MKKLDFIGNGLGNAVCQGVKNHELCDKCTRLKQGPLTMNHFVNPPATNLKTCRMFERKTK